MIFPCGLYTGFSLYKLLEPTNKEPQPKNWRTVFISFVDGGHKSWKYRNVCILFFPENCPDSRHFSMKVLDFLIFSVVYIWSKISGRCNNAIKRADLVTTEVAVRLQVSRLYRLQHDLQLRWKRTPTQVFFCENYQIFKKTFFKEHLRWLLL